MTLQELIEADRCFQYVCDNIKLDGVPPRHVLFGSTLSDWLDDTQATRKITVICEPPNARYRRATEE